MNNGRLLPPVIVEGKNGLKIESDRLEEELSEDGFDYHNVVSSHFETEI